MKKVFLFLAAASVFALVLSNCASTKILTPGAIDTDINGLGNLASCQYFLSKEVTLVFSSSQRQSSVNERTGIAQAERLNKSYRITIGTETPGILQIKNNMGDSLQGYNMATKDGVSVLTLSVLFENDNDNPIKFSAAYNDKMHRFELFDNVVDYGGLTYTVTYNGNDRPYLHYKHIEHVTEQNETRKARGRKVGN